MDLASRKLALIQAFLRLEDEDTISSFEQLLTEKQQNTFSPMTKERLNKEIDVALADSKNKTLIEHDTLKGKMKSFDFKYP